LIAIGGLMGDGPGRPPDVTDEEILEVFKQSTDPVLTASEVSEQLSIERRGVLSRLNNLEEQGYLRSKKVGGRSSVWWYPGYTSTRGIDQDP
jgi:predicted ArsR family transcriptional regulator